MTSKKRFILSVDEKQVILPEALIPKNTKAFVYELQEDGRIILSPLNATSVDSPDIPENRTKLNEVGTDFPNVLDFEACRTRLKSQTVKRRKAIPVSEPEKADIPAEGTRFVKLYLFSSRLEAEMVGEILKQAEIPYLIQSEDIGIFGPGAAPVPGGARIAVRKADLEYARIILSGLI